MREPECWHCGLKNPGPEHTSYAPALCNEKMVREKEHGYKPCSPENWRRWMLIKLLSEQDRALDPMPADERADEILKLLEDLEKKEASQ